MLDVSLRNLAFRYGGAGFALHDVTLTFPRSTHTAIAGPPASGATTLLRLLAGELRPGAGDIILGQRRVNDVKAGNRPLLFATSRIEVPSRWSVQHALVAAVRRRTLDREDRHREYLLAVEKWELVSHLVRRIDTLSAAELARLRCARVELLRPAILLADRLLEGGASLADELYRALRVAGTTVISAPSSRGELAFIDSVVVLDAGHVVQRGTASEIFARPVNDAAAIATGEVDLVPITIRGNLVDSVIGSWNIDSPPFQGSGVALVRPGDFSPARPGQESDLIFGVEEAGFADGRWIARGILSGGITLRVELPQDADVHKGRLIALRYDPARFQLLARELEPLQTSIPTDVVPPLRESR